MLKFKKFLRTFGLLHLDGVRGANAQSDKEIRRMRKSNGWRKITSGALILSFFFVPTNLAFSATSLFPKQLNYQAKLTDATNIAIPDGTYNMSFRLYTSAVSATTTNIWEETLTTTNRVTATNGLLSVLLGQVTSLASINFNQTLYLGVEIGGTTTSPVWDGEMTPRKLLGSVPSAFVADTLDGLDSAQFVQTNSTSTIASSSASTLLTLNQSGAGNILDLIGSTGANFLSVLTGGNVGIGTTSPYAKLSVVGNVVASFFTATTTATSTFAGGLNVLAINQTGSASSTFANGIQLASGCFRDSSGACLTSSASGAQGGTGAIQFANGSAFAGDATNFFFDNTTKNLGVGTSSPYSKLSVAGQVVGEYFTATSTTATSTFAGAVGIGKTTPTYKLDTLDSNNQYVFRAQGSQGTGIILGDYSTIYGGIWNGAITPANNNYSFLSGTNGSVFLNAFSSGSINFNISDINRMTVGSTGNVGIGTSSPYAKLSVVGQIVGEYFTATSTTATSTFGGGATLAVGGGNVGIGTTSPIAKLGIQGSIGVNSSQLYLAANGNVGINNSNPGSALDIVGVIRGNNGGNDVVLQDPSGNNVFRGLRAGAWADGTSGMFFQVGGDVNDNTIFSSKFGSNFNRLSFISNATQFGGTNFSTIPAPIGIFEILNTTNTNLFNVSNSGNVGIGTTSPYAKLSVVGEIVGAYFTGTTTATSTFAGGLNVLALNQTGSASSTFANGIQLASGCFRDSSGACLTSSASGAQGGTGAVQFANGTAFSSDASNFFWDDTNNRLGIGTAVPSFALSFSGTSNTTIGKERAGIGGNGNSVTLVAGGGNGGGFPDLLGGELILSSGISTGSGNSKISFLTATPGTSGVTDRTPDTKMTILGTGNVGIGTTSPYAKLSVVGQVVGEYFTATSTTATSTFGGGVNILTSTNKGLVVQGTTGAVGIGTTSPSESAMLSIGQPNSQGIGIYLNGIHANSAEAIAIRGKFGATGNAAVEISPDSLSSNPALLVNVVNSGSGAALMSVNESGVSRFTVKADGNVGVGTSSPYAKLSVADTSTITSGNYVAAIIAPIYSQGSLPATTANTDLLINRTENAIGTGAQRLIDLQVGGISKFLVTNTGNVGIGTTSPYAKLSVVGEIVGAYFTGTTTATSTFAGGLNVLAINQTGSASSTFTNGIQLSNGCFRDSSGACLTSGASAAQGGTGAVQFANGTAFAGDATNFFWDDTNKRLGIGTTSPYAKLSVAGQVVGEYFTATSTTATSTFNDVKIGGTILTDQGRADGSISIGIGNLLGATLGASNYILGGGNIISDPAITSFIVGRNNSVNATQDAYIFGRNSSVTIGISDAYILGASITNSISNSIQIGLSDTAKITLRNSGNLGIGTTSPYAKLSVVGQTLSDSFNATSSVGYQLGGTTLLTASSTLFNTFVGLGVGTSTTSGGYNTFTGYQSGQANTTGNSNTANGYRTLFSNTTGSGNTANGIQSLYSNTTGSRNTGNGFNSLYFNTTGTNNTANGIFSLYYNTIGSANTADGFGALFSNTTGSYNTALGYQTGYSLTTGYDNIFLGHDENVGGTAITTGYNNIGIGYNIKFPAVSSSNMLNLGNSIFANLVATSTSTTLPTDYSAVRFGIGTSSPWRTLSVNGSSDLGTSALAGFFTGTTTATSTFAGPVEASEFNIATNSIDKWIRWNGEKFITASSTARNTFIGLSAGTSTTNGSATDNTALGYQALQALTTGDYNTAVGSYSLFSNTTGSRNTANGSLSLRYNTTGSSSVALGTESLYNTDIYGSSTAVGYRSGYTNTTGYNNTFLGLEADALSGALTNATAIGANAIVGASNSLVLGGTGAYGVNVGIGTTSPYAKLSVVGEVVASFFTATSTATSTFVGGLNVLALNQTGSASSTFANGIQLTNGCFRDSSGACLTSSASGASGGTGAVQFANGSAFAGDTANFFWDNTTKNLGIGTSSPYAKLSVVGQTLSDSFNATSSVGYQLGGTTLLTASSTGFNTFVGLGAGTSTTSGGYNTFTGYQSGQANTTGFNNTASGYQSLFSNTTGFYNTANGYGSLYANTTGSNNTANGNYALRFNTTGSANIATGYQSLYSNTTGSNNIATGYRTLFANTTGFSNTANGDYSLSSNTTGTFNTASGYNSLLSNTTGSSSVALGYESLYNTTTFGSSTALGYRSGYTNTTGYNNTFLGLEADALSGTLTNASAIGAFAKVGASNSLILGGTGAYGVNVGIGTTSPYAKLSVVGEIVGAFYNATTSTGYKQYDRVVFTTGSSTGNIFIGEGAGTSTIVNVAAIEGIYNTFIGYQSGQANTTGSNNSTNGFRSFFSNTTGSSNTAIGHQSLYSNTTGSSNAVYGMQALYSNTSGIQNTANGQASLFFNTTGSNNTTLGYTSQFFNVSGSNNVALGKGVQTFNETGSANTTIGTEAGYGNFTFSYSSSTLIGYRAGYGLQSGSNNTLLGYQAGDALTTGSNNIIIGYDIDATSTTATRSLNIGNLLFGTGLDGAGTTVSSGNIGVGTTSPYAKLSVVGQIVGAYFTGTSTTASTFGGNVGIGNTSPVSRLDITNSATSSAIISLRDVLGNVSLELRAGTSTLYNTFIGVDAGRVNTTGSSNTANGYQSLYSNTTGSFNTANGYTALIFNTTGSFNTANGFQSLLSNTTGSSNTANGQSSLISNTTGSYNTALGYRSGYNVTTGYDNIFLGHDQNTGGTAITTGYNNIGIGYNIKFPAVSSSNMLNLGNSIFANLVATSTSTTLPTDYSAVRFGIGTSSPWRTLSVNGSSDLGTSALAGFFTGTTTATSTFAGPVEASEFNIATNGIDKWIHWNGEKFITASSTVRNTFVGLSAGTSTVNGTALDNTALGYQALQALTTGDKNTAIGNYSLFFNTTGFENTANGYYSLRSNTTGSANTGNGSFTLRSNTTGSSNAANGYQSLFSNTTGSYNTANGYGSLSTNTTGSSSVALGYESLYQTDINGSSTAVGYRSGYTNTTGYNNTFLGLEADALSATLTNATAIGSFAKVGASNSLILGGTGAFGVNVGIGTTSPYAKLSIVGSATSSAVIVLADPLGRTSLEIRAGTSTLSNTFVGIGGGQANTTGSLNTAHGAYALYVNTTGSSNTANGYSSLSSNTTGSNNTGNGYQSLYSNTTGSYNIANGYSSLYFNTTGSNNAVSGPFSLYNNTTGFSNTANGYQSLVSNTAGSYNLALGYQSGYNVTTGYDNIFLGHDENTGGTAITTGYNNIGIGYNIKFPAVSSSNMLNLGNSLFANLVATSTSTTLPTDYSAVRFGIGTSSPWRTLSVNGSSDLGTSALAGYFTGTSTTASTFGGAITVSGTATSSFVGNVTIYPGSAPSLNSGLHIYNGGLCVDNDGACYASTTGRISAVSYTTGSTDLAENYFSTDTLAKGNIVMIAGTSTPAHITLGDHNNTERILGIISTKPAIILGLENDFPLANQYPVALSGRVPVSVNLEHGPIMQGDRITISSTPGVGAKATATSSLTVGIALEDFTGVPNILDTMATGSVLTFVSLAHTSLSAQVSGSQFNLVSSTGTILPLFGSDESTNDTHYLSDRPFNMNAQSLTNVKAMMSASGKWSLDEAGHLTVESVRAKTITATERICIQDVCVNRDQLSALLISAGASGSSNSNPEPNFVPTPISTPDVPPVSIIEEDTPPAIEPEPTPEPVIITVIETTPIEPPPTETTPESTSDLIVQ